MDRIRWKLLFGICLLGLSILASIDANRNASSYYLPANVTLNKGPRHFSIVHDNATVLDTAAPLSTSTNLNLSVDATPIVVNFPTKQVEHVNLLSPTHEAHLERSSVIFGLARGANESELSPTCYAQLKHIEYSILKKEPWAMKILDASGSKPSGFVFGQNFWFGSREACGAVQRPVAITLSKNFQRVMHYAIITEQAPFDVDYRVIYLRHNSPWQVEIKLMSEQIIHIGLCLPRACTSDEVQHLGNDYIAKGLFVENDIYDINPTVMYTKDLQLRDSFYSRPSFKILVVLLTFTTIMAVAASLLRAKPLSVSKMSESPGCSRSSSPTPSQQAKPGEESLMGKLKGYVQAFDVEANCGKLFATKSTSNAAKEIPVINGLRSVCAIWILLFHVVWFMYFTVNNKTFLLYYAEQIFFQYVSSAPLLVDVFFTISGFLQTYNFMRNKSQMEAIRQSRFAENAKTFAKMLFHRYLRLAPLYLTIMCMVDLFYAYIGDVSVYHIHDRFDEMCAQNWWRNLLFIQNLFDHNNMCLNWTWSLACEMQFFVLATVLLFAYAKHPKLVKMITLMILGSVVAWSYAIGLNSKFQLSFDSAFATGTQIYISPFVRVMPYIVGAIAAWALVEQVVQVELNELQEKCLWNLAILIFFSCIYSTIKRDMSYFVSISLFVVGRFLFCLCVCWMIVGSATGRGTWWSRLLESLVFQHINRLSYAIYLLNPFVIAMFFSLTSASTHADPFMLCVLSSGFTVIVYLASIVFSVVFEMPYSNWSTLLLKSRKVKSA